MVGLPGSKGYKLDECLASDQVADWNSVQIKPLGWNNLLYCNGNMMAFGNNTTQPCGQHLYITDPSSTLVLNGEKYETFSTVLNYTQVTVVNIHWLR